MLWERIQVDEIVVGGTTWKICEILWWSEDKVLKRAIENSNIGK